jgi:hypothetical protein
MIGLASVAAAPPEAKELEKLWANLGVTDPAAAEKTMATLVAKSAQSVPFLRQRVRPVPVPDPRRVARCLADLDSEQFAVREKATQELEKMAEVVEPALQKALDKKPPPEARRRIKGLLDRLRAERLNPPAERLRIVRAVEVLERIGDTEARRVLSGLARGAPEAQLTIEAKTALERLGQTSTGNP